MGKPRGPNQLLFVILFLGILVVLGCGGVSTCPKPDPGGGCGGSADCTGATTCLFCDSNQTRGVCRKTCDSDTQCSPPDGTKCYRVTKGDGTTVGICGY